MRLKVVLYNPQRGVLHHAAGTLAVGSELDPEKYEVVIVDARLEPDPRTRCSATSRTRCAFGSPC